MTTIEGLTEEELTALVQEIDDQLMQEGVSPAARPLRAAIEISTRRKQANVLFGPQPSPLVDAVRHIYDQLFPQDQTAGQPMHSGAFMFRDMFYPIEIPIIFGSVGINPWNCLLCPDRVKQMIYQANAVARTFIDQFVDLTDFTYAHDDIVKMASLNPASINFINIAKRNLDGATAITLGKGDKYTAMQNTLLAIEVILKAVLLQNGSTEKQVRQDFRHDLAALLAAALPFLPNADVARLRAVIHPLPDFVDSRYNPITTSRMELGRIVMGGQFVAAEVLRHFSDRNVRFALQKGDDGRDYSQRHFPPLSSVTHTP